MKKRKICVVTGTRAEYGLLYWLMKEIQGDSDLLLQIVATGMHLSPEFGLTYTVIENDGFAIDEKVEMLLSSDTPVGITKSLGLGVIGFADAFDRLRPDIVVLLGDRYEALAAAEAAMVARIPLAHIHGGETTEGVIDEGIRHAITKLSQLHFVSAEPYRRRVIQLGEQPSKVYCFGAPGMDNIAKLNFLTVGELECNLDFSLGEKFFLVTYHPVTLQIDCTEVAMKNLFKALERFPEYKVLFTKPNSDQGGRVIADMIDGYVRAHKERVVSCVSLGQQRYLSAMKYCAAVIGNSSSGIIEAPVLCKPTVNIGDRQKGRLKGKTIVDCGESAESIIDAIRRVTDKGFLEQGAEGNVSLATGMVSVQIKNILKTVSLYQICQKKFYDMESKQDL